jgi:hypothetical protein
MTATASERLPLDRLVLFITCLALAGSIVAGVHYLAIDLPSQDSAKAPLNSGSMNDNCQVQYRECLAECNDQFFTPSDRSDCYRSCGKAANACNAIPPGDDPYKPKFDGPQ